MNKLVIVESPTKAKTISRFLPKGYQVVASFGHVRDLPSKDGSVEPDQNFAMHWAINERAHKHIAEIEKLARKVDTLLLATDPDREGEAISWHLLEILANKGILQSLEVGRVVFHEITKPAINQAIENPIKLNHHLVDAYLARRALDYLVGFTLSPLLWRKLPGSRSAGRVQSVALRLIAERETEIEHFIPQEYWTVGVDLAGEPNKAITARLTHLEGEKLDKFDLVSQSQATAAVEAINKSTFKVGRIEKKDTQRHPTPPFTTSTLQQEASRKFGFGASRTMRLAQNLYEGIAFKGENVGLITYMRTDSVQISQQAVSALRTLITKSYGKEYTPATPRHYKSKAKNAQEAHEAIRPTDVTLTPDIVAPYLDEAQLKLYTLIWQRTIASQMASAKIAQTSIEFDNAEEQIILRATGSIIKFDGFLRVYEEDKDEPKSDEGNRRLPEVEGNEVFSITKVTPTQHFTQPPPRYSEASLVKKLEELGIGRPSTYASIIQTLKDRDYVVQEKRQLVPQDRGRIVVSFLVHFFAKYLHYEFTAQLEEDLDEVANGQKAWKEVLAIFWRDFQTAVDETKDLRITEVIDCLNEDLSFMLFPQDDKAQPQRQCPQCHAGELSLKLGRFGAFVGCSNYPECKFTRKLGEPETTAVPEEPTAIATDPESGSHILLKQGPYGQYLEWEGVMIDPPLTKSGKKSKRKSKPKRVSIPSFIDANNITLELAQKLAALPKEIGMHPETGQSIQIGIGRFGPYIKHDNKFTSIKDKDAFFGLDLEEALALMEKASTRRQKNPAKKAAKPAKRKRK